MRSACGPETWAAEQWVDAQITFDVRDHESGARLTFRQIGSLRAYCETGEGTPFQA